ncbi:MAG: AAA-like domain-containing protein [Chromatiales bacterium]|nr:AAA-like domain-containing protein [Chromatiales bacterium]
MNQPVASNGEFFVVGGPVQPDRECYAVRAADQLLREHLERGEHCHVLAPKQTGKTSLVARISRQLRREEKLVAVVDLTQIGSPDKQYAPRRWYYGLAYRIARDLRLKVDLQTWWRAKENLPNPERLVEFFWEVVLANTTAPVAVFFDDLETLVGLPYGSEFLNSLRACHDRRATEPDFLRLSFVLLGVATPGQLQPDPSSGLFQVSNAIQLDDFDLEQISHFAPHLGVGPDLQRGLLDRVLEWTGGQPYLTQKLCRSVARSREKESGGELVDQIAMRLFLAPNCLRDEPHLNAIRIRLLEGGDKAEPLLTLYGRLCKGARITSDPHSQLHRALELSGLTTVGPDGRLQIRNKVYAEVFTARWVNQSLPFKWRVVALFAASVVFAVLLPLWYTQVLPRPYVETLSIATEDDRVAMDAYSSLRRIPGFGRTADRLLAAFLERRMSNTDDFAIAQQSLQQLSALEGREALAGGLLAAYWQRRAHAAETLQKRDDAILYRLEALAAGDESERARLHDLFGRDFPSLAATIRPRGNLENAVLSDDGGTVTTLSDGNLVRRWTLGDGEPQGSAGSALLAQEFVPLTRRLEITEEGKLDAVELSVTLNHSRPVDLYFVLTSPSGKAVELDLTRADEAREIDYIFNTTTFAFNTDSHAQLKTLRGDTRRGVWTLSVEDQGTGVTGTLQAWGLQFTPNAVEVVADKLDRGLLLPDPRSTENVRVLLGPGGRIAAATAINDLGRGQITTWDLAGGRLLAQIPERTGSSVMRFALGGDALLVTATDSAGTEVWDTRRGTLQMAVPAQGGFVVPPAVSADGRFFALAAAPAEGGTTIHIFEIGADQPIARVATDAQVTEICLAPGARRLAATARDSLLRVWEFGDEISLAESFQETPLTLMSFDSSGDWLAATARDGVLRAWDLRSGQAELANSLRRLPHAYPELLVTGGEAGQFLLWRSPFAAQLVDFGAGRAVTPQLRHATSIDQASAPTVMASLAGSAPALLSAERNGFIRVWDTAASDGDDASLMLDQEVSAITPDATVFVISSGGSVVFGRRSGANQNSVSEPAPAHAADINYLHVSDDGSWLISAAEDGSFRLWDIAAETPADVEFRNDLGPVGRAEISTRGDAILTVGAYGSRIWSALDGATRMDLGSVQVSTAITLSDDGDYVALQVPDGAVEVRAIADAEVVSRLAVGTRLAALRFAPDGDLLLAAQEDGHLVLWDWRDPRQVGQPLRLGGRMLDGRFSPNTRGILVRTDGWLHLIALTMSGPLTRVSMPQNGSSNGLPGFADRAGESLVFPPLSADAAPVTIGLDGSPGDAVAGDAGELRALWQQRLGLTVGVDGGIEPRRERAR